MVWSGIARLVVPELRLLRTDLHPGALPAASCKAARAFASSLRRACQGSLCLHTRSPVARSSFYISATCLTCCGKAARGGRGCAKTGGGWPFPYSFLSPRSCGFLGQPHRHVLFRCLNPTRRYLRGLFLEEVLNRERERRGGGREYEWFIKKPVLLKLQYA